MNRQQHEKALEGIGMKKLSAGVRKKTKLTCNYSSIYVSVLVHFFDGVKYVGEKNTVIYYMENVFIYEVEVST